MQGLLKNEDIELKIRMQLTIGHSYKYFIAVLAKFFMDKSLKILQEIMQGLLKDGQESSSKIFNICP